MGAAGVWMGTAWLLAEEHQDHMHPVNTEKLKAAGSGDTVITRSESGKTFRQIRTAWSQEWENDNAPAPLKMPYQDVLVGDLLGAIEEHDIEPLIHSGVLTERFSGENTLRTACCSTRLTPNVASSVSSGRP